MRILLCVLLFCALSGAAFPQEYDLIITTRGDSILCTIDSIGDDAIYFKMKSNSNWVATSTRRDSVAEFNYDVADIKDFKYKPGTTIIETPYYEPNSMYTVPKNSIHAGFHIVVVPLIYQRTVPVGNKFGILLGGGVIQNVMFDAATTPVAKVGFLLGGPKHFFEGGCFLTPFTEDIAGPVVPDFGYRYQSPKGFFLRADFALLFPGISIGYSF